MIALRINWQLPVITGVYAIAGTLFLHNYLCLSLTLLLALAGLFLMPLRSPAAAGTRRYAWWALLLMVCSWLLPVKTFAYGALVCALLFAVESYYTRLNAVPLLMAVLASPVAEYAATVFSFPVRISLTMAAGKLLAFTGQVTTAGNMVVFRGTEFSVDDACMGLHMLTVSLLTGIILTGIASRRAGRRMALWSLLLILAGIIFLNIISNICRIVLLAYFHLMPGTAGHELAGLCCFAFYVLLPALWSIKAMVKKWGKVLPQEIKVYTPPAHPLRWNILLALLLLSTQVYQSRRVVRDGGNRTIVLPGYTSRMRGDIQQLENGTALVYIKPIAAFFATDHHPAICWKGSGYLFRKIQEEQWDGFKVYSAVLEKGNDRLYTAWWYDNGEEADISQFGWRWNAMRTGAGYAVINVTVADPGLLRQEAVRCRQLLHGRLSAF